MSLEEPTLRTLRSQVQFEIVLAAAQVVRAAETSTRASHQVALLGQRAASFLAELRQILGRPRLNVALLDAMRGSHRVEQAELRDWQECSRRARQHEQQLREALASLRNQEQSLERALQAERRRRELRVQAAETIRADELWLQHSLREIG